MQIIDTHCHAGRNWFEPVETLIYQMNINNVDHAVLIQHGGTYDNRYLFECGERFPGRFKIVAMLDPDDSDKLGTLSNLAELGAAGIRLSPDDRILGDDPLAVWKRAGELGMVVSCQGDLSQFAASEFAELVEGCSETKIVIEHLGGVGIGLAPPYEQFLAVLALSRHANAFIKVPGLGEFVRRPPRLAPQFRFECIPPFIDMARDAFGVHRMMWGSDFPPSAGREGYRNTLEGVRTNPAWINSEEAGWVMGKSAACVWGFSS